MRITCYSILKKVQVTGPISIAAYMRQCLTSDQGGYYTTNSQEQFGKSGDFITSPEISQVFGELVGVWFMTEWIAQGRPRSGVQFIEVGPGRGTLMSDILRTIGQFKTFASAIDCVWLVEAGEGLRQKQASALQCGEMKEVERQVWEASSKYGNGIKVRWVEDIALLPQPQTNTTPFIVAHEFFDALPIHAFESVAPRPEENESKTQLLDGAGNPMVRPSSATKVPQWRELLVTSTKRKFTLSTTPDSPKSSASNNPDPDFTLTVAKASNPSSLVLPERARYRHLKSQPSSRVEISPESSRYIQNFAQRIGSSGPSSGAALIIDYGPADTIPINSLRGIKSHSIISPFLHAGQADISADVDFGALADAALEATPNVEVHGPVEQGVFLTQLGIKERAERLINGLKTNQTQQDNDAPGGVHQKMTDFETGYKRLVEGGPRGMGKAYKAMAVLPENGGKRRPVGFGGGVVG